VINLSRPLNSLQAGHWFKLICGASFQHLPAIRNLTLVYTLAGADCIDIAADPAVVHVACEALAAAQVLIESVGDKLGSQGLPWLMVSLNDGEDPHFRKAEFDPLHCPPDCSQPCLAICPAQAIAFNHSGDTFSGVLEQRCYGCGRCLPVCPIQHITTRTHASPPETIGPLILAGKIDALEIHTQVGRLAEFQTLWQAISPYSHRLKLLSISCPDGEALIEYLWSLYELLSPLPCPLIWQTDGRPMSGDIGDGATRATLQLGKKVLAADLPGYIQLAGGTNNRTVAKLKAIGLLNPDRIGHSPNPLKTLDFEAPKAQTFITGVAYGSFARALLSPVLDQIEAQALPDHPLEAFPELLQQAVSLAQALVSQIKPESSLYFPLISHSLTYAPNI
jgi:Fe-S-cluster-containing hydrogenase component 2